MFERPRRSSNKIERVSYTCEKFCNFQSTVFRGARHCPLNCCLESRERAGGGHEWRIIRSLDDIKHIQTPSLWLSAASLASQELQDDRYADSRVRAPSTQSLESIMRFRLRIKLDYQMWTIFSDPERSVQQNSERFDITLTLLLEFLVSFEKCQWKY